jgi:hypothetical protein
MERPGGLTVRVDLLWLGLIAAAASLRLARLDALPLWRWLVFREAYGSLDSMYIVEAQIRVPVP